MRTAQVATALLAAALTFSGLHAAFGHRWYGWHHGCGFYERYDGYRHHCHCYDHNAEEKNNVRDSSYRLQ